jgi:hypothetical protein
MITSTAKAKTPGKGKSPSSSFNNNVTYPSSSPSSSSSSPSSSFSSSLSLLSAGPGLSPAQAEAIWSSLRMAIREIQSHNASQLRFEELYRNAYTLVLHKYGQLLYLGVQDAITHQMQRVCDKVRTSTDDRLVACLVDEYYQHEMIMTLIKDFLMYLDKGELASPIPHSALNCFALIGALTFASLLLLFQRVLSSSQARPRV